MGSRVNPLTAGRAIKGTVLFPVRPRPHSPYRYDVLVFPRTGGMRLWSHLNHGDRARHDRAALWPADDAGFTLGELLFTQRELTEELIAHEATHAAHHYLKTVKGRRCITIGRDSNTASEEAAATCSGYLVAAITRELRKRGLLNGSHRATHR